MLSKAFPLYFQDTPDTTHRYCIIIDYLLYVVLDLGSITNFAGACLGSLEAGSETRIHLSVLC